MRFDLSFWKGRGRPGRGTSGYVSLVFIAVQRAFYRFRRLLPGVSKSLATLVARVGISDSGGATYGQKGCNA